MTNQQLREYWQELAKAEFRDELLIFGREHPLVNYGISRYVETMKTNWEWFKLNRVKYDLESKVGELNQALWSGSIC